MRTGQSRSSGRWLVLAAAVLSLSFAAEAAAQFNVRGSGGGMMRGQPSIKPPSAAVRPPVARLPTAKIPPRAGLPGGRGGGEAIIRPPRGPDVRPPRGPRGPDGMRPPRYPRGPIFVAPIMPGIFLPPAVIEPFDDDEMVPVPPPPGFRGGPPPRQLAQPPQPPRRASSGVPPANERRYVPDEVVIEVAGSFSAQQTEALARRMRLTRVESFTLDLSGTTVFRWRIPDRRSVPSVIRALEADPNVRTAQPNYLYRLTQAASPQKAALATSSDSAQTQYAFGKLKLQQAHSLAKGDNVLVAVIDSGIDADHPELAGMVADQLDAIGGDGPKAHSHGTAIAGTIVAHAKLTGVAPSARILGVRAFGGPSGDGAATTFAILKGLDWAIGRGARVVNMSFAGPSDPAISRGIASARAKGVVLVAAAGNAGPRSAPLYPAADRNVIAVTATDPDDKLFTKANRGKHIAVAAPGVDILLPAPNAAYQVSSGTSFSAAFVSGTVALLFERKPGLTPEDVRRVLVDTAADLGPKGRDDQFGAGLVDAYQAVSSLAPAAEAETTKPIPAAVR